MIKYIFIIPYRNREQHKHFFSYYMNYLLEDYDKDTYEIVFSQQNDDRPFNRGAMKNIGFLYAKNKYSYYKDIIFIFNDVDTLPYKKGLLNYDLELNEIKHYYGFTHTLGGIFAIRGDDFEKINGFPNFWSWGYEDNVIYDRAISNHIHINRSQFYKIGDNNILHLIDDFHKNVSIKMRDNYHNNKITDGIKSIHNLNYSYDNVLLVHNFVCSYNPNETLTSLNLLSPVKKGINLRKIVFR